MLPQRNGSSTVHGQSQSQSQSQSGTCNQSNKRAFPGDGTDSQDPCSNGNAKKIALDKSGDSSHASGSGNFSEIANSQQPELSQGQSSNEQQEEGQGRSTSSAPSTEPDTATMNRYVRLAAHLEKFDKDEFLELILGKSPSNESNEGHQLEINQQQHQQQIQQQMQMQQIQKQQKQQQEQEQKRKQLAERSIQSVANGTDMAGTRIAMLAGANLTSGGGAGSSTSNSSTSGGASGGGVSC